MFNKLFKIKVIKEKRLYKGLEALKLPAGSIVKVFNHIHKDGVGSILLRIDNDLHPFICVAHDAQTPNFNIELTSAIGSRWGNSIENYEFLLLRGMTIEDFNFKL